MEGAVNSALVNGVRVYRTLKADAVAARNQARLSLYLVKFLVAVLAYKLDFILRRILLRLLLLLLILIVSSLEDVRLILLMIDLRLDIFD